MPGSPLARRLLAEAAGTALLVLAIVGSGIAASRLGHDPAVVLLANALATAGALAAAILIAGPISGGHLNPAVSASAWWLGRGLPGRDLALYVPAQVAGGVTGCVLANVMYSAPAVEWSATRRGGGGLLLADAVATAGLVLLVFALARSRRVALAPAAVAAYVGSAYWFTSSTGFANPAVTVARMFTGTYTGIAPRSVPALLAAQLAGAVAGAALATVLYPAEAAT